MSFINKEYYIQQAFVRQNPSGVYVINPLLKTYRFDKENVELTVSNYDITSKFYGDDEFYLKYPNNLPDATEFGEMLLFANLEDCITIAERYRDEMNAKRKIKGS